MAIAFQSVTASACATPTMPMRVISVATTLHLTTPLDAPGEVTQLLIAWSDGDEDAREELMPLVYGELHRLAHGYMRRERPGHTLQTSGLINEAYLRLIDQNQVQWQNRAH